MKTVVMRRLSDEDYDWLKQQAESAGMMLETWMRLQVKNRSIGQPSSPAAVTLAPTGPLIATNYQPESSPKATTRQHSLEPTAPTQSLPIEDVLREADLEDSPKARVAALQHMYDELFPPSGSYKYARLTESRAKEWLRCCGGSAIAVYDVLMDRVWNRVDDDGNYCDYRGKPFDNPAVYASAVLKSHRAASESLGSYKAYGHEAPLKELDPFPLEERDLCYKSSALAARRQGSISDDGWAKILHISEEAGRPYGEEAV